MRNLNFNTAIFSALAFTLFAALSGPLDAKSKKELAVEKQKQMVVERIKERTNDILIDASFDEKDYDAITPVIAKYVARDFALKGKRSKSDDKEERKILKTAMLENSRSAAKELAKVTHKENSNKFKDYLSREKIRIAEEKKARKEARAKKK